MFEDAENLDRLLLLRRLRGDTTVAESERNLLPKDFEEEEADEEDEFLFGLLRDSRFNSDGAFWMEGRSSGRGFMEERR